MAVLRAHLDFETASPQPLGAQASVGVYRYAEDPDTRIWGFCWRLGSGGVFPWYPGDPAPRPLLDHIDMGRTIVAHNAPFEFNIWNTVLPRIEPTWPRLLLGQMNCTMARAMALGLPADLDRLGKVLGTANTKDDYGHSLMLKMAKPRGNDIEGGYLWHDDSVDIKYLIETYCARDVLTECDIDAKLPDLSPSERDLWDIDQKINMRGVGIDVVFARRAVALGDISVKFADQEMRRLTNNQVSRCTEVAKIVAWIQSRGLPATTLQKHEIDEYIALAEFTEDDAVRQVVQLRQAAAKTSTAKYAKMMACANSDGRVRGMLQYHGARTGRWCLTGDHEVLTREGWCRLDEYWGGAIACWSPDGAMAFLDSEANVFEFSGELTRLHNFRIDQTSTDDHRMPVFPRSDRGGNFTVRTAASVKQYDRIPVTGMMARPAGIPEVILRILVMVQADAHYHADGVRFSFKKPRKIFRCEHLLRAARIGYKKYSKHSDGRTSIEIVRKNVPHWLAVFKDKKFRWDWLDCDADVFFEELALWDGSQCGPKSVQYGTKVRSNADFVQALAHTSGRAVRMSVRTSAERGKSHWSDMYVASVWDNPGPAELRFAGKSAATSTKVPYTGLVYCPTTPTGFFLVRRGETAWVTGNSGRGPQPQNYPRFDHENADDVAQVEALRLALLSAKPVAVVHEELRAAYGPVLPLLAKALRSTFVTQSGGM